MSKTNPKITLFILQLITLTAISSCQPTQQSLSTEKPLLVATEQETAVPVTPEIQTVDTRSTPTPPPENFEETFTVGEASTPTPLPTPPDANSDQTILVYPQAQSPVYLVNFLHPELGCQWTGVAGQIFNAAGSPVNGYIVEVSGKIGDRDLLALGLTGTSLPIGPGGYEIKLADQPFDSDDMLYLKIFDQNGTQLNESLPLTTYNDCRKNLILINFILLNQPLREKIYLPIIHR